MKVEKRQTLEWVIASFWLILLSILFGMIIISPLTIKTPEIQTSEPQDYLSGVEYSFPETPFPVRAPINISGNENIALYAQGGDGLSRETAFIFENFSIQATNTSCIMIQNTSAFITFRNIQLNGTTYHLTGMIDLIGCSNIHLSNISLYSNLAYYDHGILLTDCSFISTDNNILLSNFWEGLVFEHISFCDFRSIISLNNVKAGKFSDIREASFTECFFERGNLPDTIQNINVQFKDNSREISINNCYFNQTAAGISVYDCRNFEIVNNTFIDVRLSSVSIGSSTDITFQSNFIGQSVDPGYDIEDCLVSIVNSKNIRISSNIFHQECQSIVRIRDIRYDQTILIRKNVARGNIGTWINTFSARMSAQLIFLNRLSHSLLWWGYTLGFGTTLGFLLYRFYTVSSSEKRVLNSGSKLTPEETEKGHTSMSGQEINPENLKIVIPILGKVFFTWIILSPITWLCANPPHLGSVNRLLRGNPNLPTIIVIIGWCLGLLSILMPQFWKKQGVKPTLSHLKIQFLTHKGAGFIIFLISILLWLTIGQLNYEWQKFWYWFSPFPTIFLLLLKWRARFPSDIFEKDQNKAYKGINSDVNWTFGALIVMWIVWSLPSLYTGFYIIRLSIQVLITIFALGNTFDHARYK